MLDEEFSAQFSARSLTVYKFLSLSNHVILATASLWYSFLFAFHDPRKHKSFFGENISTIINVRDDKHVEIKYSRNRLIYSLFCEIGLFAALINHGLIFHKKRKLKRFIHDKLHCNCNNITDCEKDSNNSKITIHLKRQQEIDSFLDNKDDIKLIQQWMLLVGKHNISSSLIGYLMTLLYMSQKSIAIELQKISHLNSLEQREMDDIIMNNERSYNNNNNNNNNNNTDRFIVANGEDDYLAALSNALGNDNGLMMNITTQEKQNIIEKHGIRLVSVGFLSFICSNFGLSCLNVVCILKMWKCRCDDVIYQSEYQDLLKFNTFISCLAAGINILKIIKHKTYVDYLVGSKNEEQNKMSICENANIQVELPNTNQTENEKFLESSVVLKLFKKRKIWYFCQIIPSIMFGICGYVSGVAIFGPISMSNRFNRHSRNQLNKKNLFGKMLAFVFDNKSMDTVARNVRIFKLFAISTFSIGLSITIGNEYSRNQSDCIVTCVREMHPKHQIKFFSFLR